MEKSRFLAFLERHDQQEWNRVLDRLSSSIHPVDRVATFIWFAFWPLELAQALADPAGLEEMARVMDLEGEWRLEEQVDRAVGFLYGARFWPQVKKAVLAHAGSIEQREGGSLEQQIRSVARGLAGNLDQSESILLGVTAVAFMVLQQVGTELFRAVVDRPAEGPFHRGSPEDVLQQRRKKSRDGIFWFLKGVGRRYRVVWEERKADARFLAYHGQDLAMAAATDRRHYRSLDYRRIEGPVPVECRVGSCGYCWVGALSGRENLSPIGDFEKGRLHYFGYDSANRSDDAHPPIRLACQAQCFGDVTLAIPLWNGELKRRFDHTARDLGTV